MARRGWRNGFFPLVLLALLAGGAVRAQDELEEKLADAREELAEDEAKVDEYKRLVDETAAEVEKLDRDLERLQKTIEAKQENYDKVSRLSTARRPNLGRWKTDQRARLSEELDELRDDEKDLSKELKKAKRALKSAESKLARAERDAERSREDVAELGGKVKEERRDYMTELAEALTKNPDDTAANREAGLYLCFELDKWNEGLPHLAKSGDPKLAAVAKVEMNKPRSPGAFIELGKGWKELGEAQKEPELKHHMLMRAAHWFRKVLPSLPTIKRVGFEEKIKDLEAEAKAALE